MPDRDRSRRRTSNPRQIPPKEATGRVTAVEGVVPEYRPAAQPRSRTLQPGNRPRLAPRHDGTDGSRRVRTRLLGRARAIEPGQFRRRHAARDAQGRQDEDPRQRPRRQYLPAPSARRSLNSRDRQRLGGRRRSRLGHVIVIQGRRNRSTVTTQPSEIAQSTQFDGLNASEFTQDCADAARSL